MEGEPIPGSSSNIKKTKEPPLQRLMRHLGVKPSMTPQQILQRGTFLQQQLDVDEYEYDTAYFYGAPFPNGNDWHYLS